MRSVFSGVVQLQVSSGLALDRAIEVLRFFCLFLVQGTMRMRSTRSCAARRYIDGD
jgi:hypothetical protein